MRNIPAELREKLSLRAVLPATRCLEVDGTPKGTRKMVIGLRDGEEIETVIIPARGRRTVCVSTQAGCAYGCAFCASGMNGLSRNLTAGEIVVA